MKDIEVNTGEIVTKKWVEEFVDNKYKVIIGKLLLISFGIISFQGIMILILVILLRTS